MAGQLLIFEGYDGSGKSTLIDAIRLLAAPRSVRIVERKTEPSLQAMSAPIEADPSSLAPDAEVLLRMALETQRQHLMLAALACHDFVIADRGVLSVRAWLDYYGLPPGDYTSTFARLDRILNTATTITCASAFDSCWARISGKANSSKKERLGKAANERFYRLYGALADRYAQRFPTITVDTEHQSVDDSARAVVAELDRRGLW